VATDSRVGVADHQAVTADRVAVAVGLRSLGRRIDKSPASGVCDVIVTALGVVDAVLAAACGVAF